MQDRVPALRGLGEPRTTDRLGVRDCRDGELELAVADLAPMPGVPMVPDALAVMLAAGETAGLGVIPGAVLGV